MKKTEEEMENDMERGEISSQKKSLLELLCGGPMLQSQVTGN
jgi:hypothetical protein